MNEPQRYLSSRTEVDDLRRRLHKLEAECVKPLNRTSMQGAAEYLGRSKEWLRQRHLLGQGPRRARIGSRGWSYTYQDLDRWLAEQAHDGSFSEFCVGRALNE
jgi:hypothetical protein